MSLFHSQAMSDLRFQEDEEEIKRRKMRAEEEDVDIDTMPSDPEPFPTTPDDEDLIWAEQEPDDDTHPWKMKIHMEDHHLDGERGL